MKIFGITVLLCLGMDSGLAQLHQDFMKNGEKLSTNSVEHDIPSSQQNLIEDSSYDHKLHLYVSTYLRGIDESEYLSELFNKSIPVFTNPVIFYPMDVKLAIQMHTIHPRKTALMIVQSLYSVADILTGYSYARGVAVGVGKTLRDYGILVYGNGVELAGKYIDVLEDTKYSPTYRPTPVGYAQAFCDAMAQYMNSFDMPGFAEVLGKYFSHEMHTLRMRTLLLDEML